MAAGLMCCCQACQFFLLLALRTVDEYRVERRDDEQRQQGREREAANHGDAHGLPRLRPDTRADRQS